MDHLSTQLPDPTIEPCGRIRLFAVFAMILRRSLDQFEPHVVAVGLEQDDRGRDPKRLGDCVKRTIHVVQDATQMGDLKGIIVARDSVGAGDLVRDVPVAGLALATFDRSGRGSSA